MYLIVIACMSFYDLCRVAPLTPERYETLAECNRALVKIAEQWKPSTGAYRFNCYRV